MVLRSSSTLLCIVGYLLLTCPSAEALFDFFDDFSPLAFFLEIACFITLGFLPFCEEPIPATPSPTLSPTITMSPTVSMSPTRSPGFQIDAQMELPQQAATLFQAEIERWQEIIVGELEPVSFADLPSRRLRDIFSMLSQDAAPCEIPLVVDDHYICVVQGGIDGVNGVLGFASILFVRGDDLRLPVVSFSQFDSADVPNLLSSGGANFGTVARHEFGHALGLVHTNRFPACASDSIDASPEANRRFQELSGCDFPTPTNANAGDPGCGQYVYIIIIQTKQLCTFLTCRILVQLGFSVL